MNFQQKCILCSLVAGLVVVFPSANAQASNGVRTVALSDLPAPGLGAETNIGSFDPPVINSRGRVAFRSLLSGPQVDSLSEDAIFSEGGGNGLTLIVREGQTLSPTTIVNRFSNLGEPLLSDNGHTVFHSGVISLPRSLSGGIFRDGEGSNLELVVSDREDASFVEAGLQFFGVGNPLVNDQGSIAFVGNLRSEGIPINNGFGFFRETPGGALELVVRRGDEAPGTAGNGRYDGSFNFREPALNNRGQLAFLDEVKGLETDNIFDRGIFLTQQYSGNRDEAMLVALPANPAPEAEELAYFWSLGQPALNNHGHTAFSATLGGTPIDDSNDAALYSNAAGNGLQIIAREGMPAPGTEPGEFFGRFDTPVLNSAGQIAFGSFLQGDGVDANNDDAIYKQLPDGSLKLIARAGAIAPGTPDGVTFGGRRAFDTSLSLNSRGQTAFLAFLLGLESQGRNEGIFAEDVNGTLQPIAHTGQLFDVSDDPLAPDMRTIAGLQFVSGSGNEDGRRSGFNDAGQLAFWASFTDGSSGIFVSNRVAIPEPGSLVLFVCGGALLLCGKHDPESPRHLPAVVARPRRIEV